MTFSPVVEDTVVPELCSEYDELTGDSGKVAGELTVVGGKVDGGAVEGPAIKSMALKLGHCNPER